MKIPAYWSQATAEETQPNGTTLSHTAWRSSDRSVDDARQSALAAAKQLLQNMLTRHRPDEYAAYWQSPLREEVLQRFTNRQGELVAAVTRNKYGALVLNVGRVLFIDIDFPTSSSGERLNGFFRRVFRRSSPSPEEEREQTALAAWQQFIASRPEWSSRVYRTAAGLRVMVTHDLFDPCDDRTTELLKKAGCDPLYIRLCKAQENFRARLTPKPRRCGVGPIRVRWPYETAETQRSFAEWQAKYDLRQANFATCRFLGVVGSGVVHPEIAPMIELHDVSTRATERLKLA